MNVRTVGLLLIAHGLVLPSAAHADRLGSEFLSRTESKLIRRDAAKLGLQAFALVAPAEPRLSYSLTLGIAYIDGEDGSKTWNTPFEFDVQLADQRTVFKIAGDGYTHLSSGDTTLSGLSKLIVGASHAVPIGDGKKFLIGGGVTIPTGGDVGGSSASQYALAGFSALFADLWQTTLIAKGIRSNASPIDGVSRYAVAGVAQLKRRFGDNDVVVSIDRLHRGGAGGQTNVGATLDLQWTKADVVSFGVTRGITSGARDTALEVDFSHDF